jgi:hypothetical protein
MGVDRRRQVRVADQTYPDLLRSAAWDTVGTAPPARLTHCRHGAQPVGLVGRTAQAASKTSGNVDIPQALGGCFCQLSVSAAARSAAVGWVYRRVVSSRVWPSRSATMTRSTPSRTIWVAKV